MEATNGLPQPKPRVLLIAEEANPEWVSVNLVGWSSARALAKIADVHLVTQVRNRPAILRAGLTEGADFTAIDTEAIARPAFRIGEWVRGPGQGFTIATAITSLLYPYFEHLVWRRFRGRILGGEFDVVHRLTPLTPTAPSLLAGRCRRGGVPFVLGPLNGGLPWPAPFRHLQRQQMDRLSRVRALHKLVPGYGATRRNAAAIIAGSVDVLQQVPGPCRKKCVYIPENAVEPNRFTRNRSRRADRPVRAVFVGRLVHYKGADLLLEAAAPLIRAGGLRLRIIGDGPQMPELRELVCRERIQEGVAFDGWVEHGRIADYLVDSDVLTFPSVREFGGAVVLEAMAVGLVPVVIDYGGPGELATDRTGFLIPMGDRAQLIERLRDVLTGIAANPTQLEPKSRAAIERVRRYFTWDAKAEQVLEVYRWVLGQRPEKPSFPAPFPDEHIAVAGHAAASL
jgi:glycosyltransferase involved in cell wall biosynthesis